MPDKVLALLKEMACSCHINLEDVGAQGADIYVCLRCRALAAVEEMERETLVANGQVIARTAMLNTLSQENEQTQKQLAAERQAREKAEASLVQVGEQIEHDRTLVANCITAANKAIDSRHWLTEGRGSYEWDDDRWHSEFYAAAQEIKSALKPMATVAADWRNCPMSSEEVAKARIDLKERAELAEKRLETIGTVTLCEKCNGTGILPGGTAEYPASGCCSIGHARECACNLCAWRKQSYRQQKQLEAAVVALEQIQQVAQRAARDSTSRDDDRRCIADVIYAAALALAGGKEEG